MNQEIPGVQTYPSIAQSFGIAGIAILMFLVCAVVLVLQTYVGAEAAMFIYYLLSMGLTFVIVNSIRKKKIGSSTFDFRIRPRFIALPLVLGSVALLIGIVQPVSHAIPMPEAVQKGIRELLGQTGVWTLLYFVISAPILEELIFRGIMLDGLLRRYSPVKSILVSSLLFGAVHLNPWQFVTGLFFGLFAGWVYFRTASLGACILIHMAANGTGYVMRLILKTNGGQFEFDQSLVDSFGGMAWMVSIIGGSLIVFLLCVMSLRRSLEKSAMSAAWPGWGSMSQ